MCGFTGYFNKDQTSETTNATIRKMLALQKHRGPDDSGIVAVDTRNKKIEEVDTRQNSTFSRPANLLFGFNRLSILDLSKNGHQPMMDTDRQVVLMLNGEIYNAFEYKEDLIQKGYKFKSTTDTEVVLNLYLEYGFENMLKRLNGMFAIVILDLRSNKLYLTRDRFGIKPLYVLQENSRLAFSSEIKSFKALPNFKFELNENRLDEFLIFRNTLNKTLFKNIQNLEPGTFWEIALSTGSIQKQTYFSLYEPSARPPSFSAENLKNALSRAVESQLLSDVKVGAQLSGGVDSSMVTYFASSFQGKGNTETISIIFDDPRFTEEGYINRVSEQLELESHKYTMTSDYYFDKIEEATWHFEQPLNHPNSIGLYLLSQKAKEHVTVLLSGEGADELLAGYDRFVGSSQPSYFTKSFLGQLKRNRKNLGEFLAYYRNENLRMVMASAFGNIENSRDVKPDFNLDRALAQRKKIAEDLKNTGNQKQRKYELLTYLPDLLMRQDKMSMAHSIENRVPFLDNNFVDFGLQLPLESLVAKRDGKWEGKLALKLVCAELFSESFAFRKKQGFGIPLREFMLKKAFQEKWNHELFPAMKERNVFDVDKPMSWMNSIKTLPSNKLESLWMMISFEIWAKQYLDA